MTKRNSSQRKSRQQFPYESLEARRVLANIAMIDSHMGYTAKETVLIGENIGVAANYSTDSLPANSAFDIKIEVNGIVGYINNISNGAGGDDAEFKSHVNTWSIFEGPIVVEVWLDYDNKVSESNEDDNYYRFEFTPVQPDIESPFIFPWQGENFDETVIYSHGSINPHSPYVDHTGQQLLTNSFSVYVVNNDDLHGAIPIYAMADGEVSFVEDGTADRYMPGTTHPYPNKVRILHGGEHNFQSIISYLRTDSIFVNKGDVVKQGDLIGYMAGSLYRSNAYASWTIFGNNATINLFAAENIYLQDAPDHAFSQVSVYDGRISNYADPQEHVIDGVSEFATFHPEDQSDVHLYVRMGALNFGDNVKYQWRDPNGNLFSESAYHMPWLRSLHSDAAMMTLPENAEQGTWSVDVLVNNSKIYEQTFEVASTRMPEIRIEESNYLNGEGYSRQDHRLVSSGRHSAFDMGVHELGDTSKTFEYEVFNHGTDVLTISELKIPAGFTLIDGLETSLAPGTSDLFSIVVDTSFHGFRQGQIQVVSNDADESQYSFWVEGAVRSANSLFTEGALSIGTEHRTMTEGSMIYVTVRMPDWKPGETVINLDYGTSAISGPASVSIPQGLTRISFPVSSDADSFDSGDLLLNLTATLDSDTLDVATTELNLLDAGAPEATPGRDIVVLDLNESDMSLTINGTRYPIDPSVSPHMTIDGMGGADQLQIIGSSLDEVVYIAGQDEGDIALGLSLASVTNDLFTFEYIGMQAVSVEGNGGFDDVTMWGVPNFGATLYSDNGLTTLESDGYMFESNDVDVVRAKSQGQGPHTSTIIDSPADDQFHISPTLTYFNGPTGIISAVGFANSEVRAISGGNDQAVLIGTDESDHYYSDENVSRLADPTENKTYRLLVKGFERTITRTEGGEDSGRLVGLNKSQAYSGESYSYLRNGDHFARVEGVETLMIVSQAAGSNIIFDGSSEADYVYTTPDFMKLSTPSRWVRAQSFDNAIVNGGDGIDTVNFYDSEGDDRFRSAQNDAWMSGEGFFNRALHFENILATASSGNDINLLFGTVLNDYVVSTASSTRITSDNYYAWASGFSRNSILLNQSGFDIVRILDSPDDDSAFLSGTQAFVESNEVTRRFEEMDRVVAISENGGFDQLFENDIEFELFKFGDWA